MLRDGIKVAGLLGSVWLIAISLAPLMNHRWILFLPALFFLLALYKLEWALLTFIFLIPFQPKIQSHFNNPDIFFLEGLFFLLVLSWYLKSVLKDKEIKSDNPLWFPLSLFSIIAALSSLLAINTTNYFSSIIFWHRLAGFFQGELTMFHPFRIALTMGEGILIFLIIGQIITTPAILKKSLAAILTSSFLVALYGLYQYYKGEFALSWRLTSTLSDVNSFGSYLVLLSFIPLLVSFTERKWLKPALGINACLLLTCIILTGSKISMVAFFLSAVITSLILIQHKLKSIKLKIALVSSIALFLAFFFILVTNKSPRLAGKGRPYLEFFVNAFDYSYIRNYFVNYRGHQWKAAIEMIKDYPVLGIGLGEYYFKLEKYRNPDAPGYNPIRENAHNYFLQLGAEAGLLGLAIFIWILWLIFKYQRSILKCTDKAYWEGYAIGLGSGLIGYLITCITGHPLLLIEQQWLFWTTVGLIFSIGQVAGAPYPVKRNNLRRLKVPFLILFFLFSYYWLQANVNKDIDIKEYSYGFYAWEEAADLGRFRWTGSKAKALLKIEGKILNIPLADGGYGLAKDPPRVQLYLKNELLDTIIVNSKNWQVFQYYLPINRGQGNDRIILVIQPDKTWVPAQLGLNDDQRTLGVIVREISWSEGLTGGETGFYAWEEEKNSGKRFRWTRKQASSHLSITNSKLSIEVKAARTGINRSPQALRFYFNDQLLRDVHLKDHLWTPIILDLPPGEKEGILTLQTDRTWNPSRAIISSDNRELGVMVAPWSFIP